MSIVRQERNHSYLTLKTDLFQALKKEKVDAHRDLNRSYEPILRNLSSDSWHQRDGGSLENLENFRKQQSQQINFLMNNEGIRQTNHSWNGEGYGLGNLHSSWAISDKQRGNLSAIGEVKSIFLMVKDITSKNPGGLDLIQMHLMLCNALGEEFNAKKYGCENLFNFLKTHCSKIIDVKKETHGPTGMISIFVYPKSSRIGLFNQGSDDFMRNRNLMASSKPFQLTESIDESKQSPVRATHQMANSQGVKRRQADTGEKSHRRVGSYLFKSDLAGSYIKPEIREDLFQNNSTNEIMDFLDYLGSQVSWNEENFMTGTFMSHGPDSEGSHLTLPSEVRSAHREFSQLSGLMWNQQKGPNSLNHSRGLSMERKQLIPVAETALEKDKSDSQGINEDNLNRDGEPQPAANEEIVKRVESSISKDIARILDC